MNILKKYNLIFKTTFFSILVFLGSFNVGYAMWPFDSKTVYSILSFIAETMIWISAQILALAGFLFNYSIQYTLNFKDLVDGTGIVNIGWEIIRDMSNMIFIFILISVAIGTILGLQNYNAKNTIKNIILAALFINFSLFITGVIIDASNVMAIGFYNATIQGTSSNSEDDSIFDLDKNLDKGISGIFAQSLKISSIYNKEGLGAKNAREETAHKNIFTIGLFGSIFLLITAFVFFAAAILFIIRTVVLMFLMMTSPIAFVGLILPQTKLSAKKWWNELFSQAFFAPVYLMFIYIVATGVTSDAFKTTLGGAGSGSFAGAFTGGGGMIIVIFNFLLIITLLLGSLIAAKKMGATGAEGLVKMGRGMSSGAQKWAQGRVGAATFGATGRLVRSTIGAGADRIAVWGKNKQGATTWGGKLALKGLRGVADSSFDARNTTLGKAVTDAIPGGLGKGIKGGYTTKTKARAKAEIKYGQSLGKIKVKKGDDINLSEVYGKKIRDRKAGFVIPRNSRNIWSTLTGTTKGDRDAAKSLVDLPQHERDLKIGKEYLEIAKKAGTGTEVAEAQRKVDKLNSKIKKIEDLLKDK